MITVNIGQRRRREKDRWATPLKKTTADDSGLEF